MKKSGKAIKGKLKLNLMVNSLMELVLCIIQMVVNIKVNSKMVCLMVKVKCTGIMTLSIEVALSREDLKDKDWVFLLVVRLLKESLRMTKRKVR